MPVFLKTILKNFKGAHYSKSIFQSYILLMSKQTQTQQGKKQINYPNKQIQKSSPKYHQIQTILHHKDQSP